MKPTVLVASNYLPPICGGAEWAAWEITKRLADRYEIHIITTSIPTPEIEHLVRVHRLPRLRWMPLSYSTVHSLTVKRLLREVSPDLIHCHLALPWGYVMRNARVSKVITCHGAEAREPGDRERYFIKSALKHATVVTTPGKWMVQFIKDEFGKDSLNIPNGVDTKTFRPIPGVNRRENVILFVGRFIKNKGVLDLAEAARHLPEYEFWFVGSSEQENIGKRGVDIPKAPNIKIMEFVEDREAMAALYNQATICAFPSQFENFPLVGLEAMACGKPVVATTGPRNGFSEYLDNEREGLLIAPHDVRELVNAIRQLIGNEGKLEELGSNAVAKASHYDWDIVVEKYDELLEKLLHR